MTGRLTPPDPRELSPAQRELYQRFTTGPRAQTANVPLVEAGAVLGPAQVWLVQPSLGLVLERLGATVRFESTLTARAREIATLLVAHHHASAFELYAHKRLARTAGLTDDDVAALAAGTPPGFADGHERAVYAVTRRLLAAGDLSDAEYAEAVRQLGVERLVEIVTLVGYYGLLALQLRVFRVNPPSDCHQCI